MASADHRARINAKRTQRRSNLAARLQLAERDAMQQREERAPKRTKPTIAPYLQQAAGEREASEPEVSDQEGEEAVSRREASEPEASDREGALAAPSEVEEPERAERVAHAKAWLDKPDEQLADSDEEPERAERVAHARAWLDEPDEPDRSAAGKRRPEPRVPVVLCSAGEARHKVNKIHYERAPWRSSSSCGSEGPLDGGRGVVPRWQTERLVRAEHTKHVEQPTDLLLGKVATQLLRWGRSDVRGPDGIKTIKLRGWQADTWMPVSLVAEAMGVRADLLSAEVLQSMGSHGPRLQHREHGEQGPEVKACWADR